MRQIKVLNITSSTLLSVILTFIAIGCVPSKKEAPNTTQISTLSEKAATCESSLRQKMENKGLKLQRVTGLEAEINAANKSVDQANDITYSLDKSTQIGSVKVEHMEITQNISHSIRYELAKSDEGSATPLTLSVEVENVNPTSDLTLSQSFNVSESCELTITTTERATISRLGSTDYTYEKVSIFLDGQNQKESDQFKVPVGEKLLNFIPASDNLDHLPLKSYGYMPKVGVLEVTTENLGNKKVQEFGLELKLKSLKANFTLDGKPILSIVYGEDKTQGVISSEIGGHTSWKLPKNLWESLNLGSSENINAMIHSEIPKEYLYDHNSIKLLADQEPSYDHFKAYWTISDRSVDAQTKQQVFTLTEKDEPTIDDESSAEDLISNDTIQTKLPQVQAIAKDILSQQPSDRRAQIQLILDYLSTHYTYDYEMVKNNNIRPLTTEEAFSRGKGVCQHYAVIFTTIARALKIPTRIVMGYLLGNWSAGSHAWVEAEVLPGVWRVIEPQSQNGLTQTHTRFYFPTARAKFLEDKNSNLAEYITLFVQD
ncbi:MAG: transglutaminase-like domain-containing protein, partial [Pseudobdellovibrionaceae bacterium]